VCRTVPLTNVFPEIVRSELADRVIASHFADDLQSRKEIQHTARILKPLYATYLKVAFGEIRILDTRWSRHVRSESVTLKFERSYPVELDNHLSRRQSQDRAGVICATKKVDSPGHCRYIRWLRFRLPSVVVCQACRGTPRPSFACLENLSDNPDGLAFCRAEIEQPSQLLRSSSS
jgi:hypothetical protein